MEITRKIKNWLVLENNIGDVMELKTLLLYLPTLILIGQYRYIVISVLHVRMLTTHT